ncbi:MAG: hypothetical protein P8N76_17670 [Pirellulaceae bacterium]|nr:hypothetical protein [Pirellulaceae bacterium]
MIAVTNAETGNPLMREEITTIHKFYHVHKTSVEQPRTTSLSARTKELQLEQLGDQGSDRQLR